VVRNRRSGYTLLEMVVAMAIFAVVTFILLSLTRELAFWERRLKLDFLRHPQIVAVISRMRRDVADAWSENPYAATAPGYSNTPKTLVLWTLNAAGGQETIVWDFSNPGVVERRAYAAGDTKVWRARGVPRDFTADIESATNPSPFGIVGVRIKAVDSRGRVAIDQTFFPRTTREDPVEPPEE
jgi:prepilin-type N-terminal cleavage/methylation domain-containing protein